MISSSAHIPYTCIACTVKNMQTGEQVKLSPADAAEHIAAVIKERNSGAVIKE